MPCTDIISDRLRFLNSSFTWLKGGLARLAPNEWYNRRFEHLFVTSSFPFHHFAVVVAIHFHYYSNVENVVEWSVRRRHSGLRRRTPRASRTRPRRPMARPAGLRSSNSGRLCHLNQFDNISFYSDSEQYQYNITKKEIVEAQFIYTFRI